jgi:hypothetical protein
MHYYNFYGFNRINLHLQRRIAAVVTDTHGILTFLYALLWHGPDYGRSPGKN